MKKCGSTASSSKVTEQLVDIINSLSLETTNSVVQKNATDGCQKFSMRQYVADTREKDPKACNPFGEKNYRIWEQLKAPLDVPQFKWWGCTNCVRDLVASRTPDLHELQETSVRANAQPSTLHASIEHRASGGDATEGEGSKGPIEVINLDDSDSEGKIQETSPLEELATLALLLEEKESAEGVRTLTMQLTEKRPSPISQNTDLHPRKRSKATGESSRSYQRKQKGTLKGSGTGANPLVQNLYEKLPARHTSAPSVDCIANKNPADISVPGPRNKYMIRGKDLKLKNGGKRRRETN